MRCVHFDYPETCPRIDRVARELQQLVEQFLTQEDAESIDDSFWKIVDGFRDINSDMRAEADGQISALKREIENLEYALEDAVNELDDAKNELEEYKSMYEGLCE